MNDLLNLAFVVLKYIAAASMALSISVLLAGHRLVKLSNESRMFNSCKNADKSQTKSPFDF